MSAHAFELKNEAPSNRIHVEGTPVTFADLTTMGVGGQIANFVEARTEDEIIAAVQAADQAQQPLLMLGGGSNTLATDEPFTGTVVRDLRQQVTLDSDSGCGGASVTATAGVPWDDFVAYTVEQEWMGLEALSGIPGTVGAAPVQNIGAYGQEVAETIASVRVWDRLQERTRLLPLADLELSYRDSILKRSLRDREAGGGRLWGPTGRWIVLEVSFQFRHASLSAPIRYAQLARELGVAVGERVSASLVRQKVLEIRRSKGMVLDDADRDTWSCGSFFTNPIVSLEQAATLPEGVPRFPVEQRSLATGIDGVAPVLEDTVKVSAAWLIQHAGFAPGFSLPGSRAGLSSRHCLAITNRGNATGAEVRDLCNHIRAGVREKFGVELHPEPVIINAATPSE